MKKIFPLDPYNEEHLKIIKEIINKDEFETYFCNMLLVVRDRFSKEDYLEIKNTANEIEELLIVEEDSKIKGYCHIHGEKDIKMCKIAFPKNDSILKSNILGLTEYAQNELGFEEVFIKLDLTDKNKSKKLEELGFESLGEESGSLIFLKEREPELNRQRKI